MRRSGSAVAALAVTALLLTGCTGTGAEDDPSGLLTPVATDSATTDADDGPPPTPVPSPTPSGPNGRLELSGWDQFHSNPTSIELQAIEVDDAGHILIDLDAVNSYHRGQVRLALNDVFATDDLGTSYEFVRPVGTRDEQRLGLDADQRLSGTLAFVGPVDPEATTLDVGFNNLDSRQDGFIAAEEDTQGQFPKFYFAGVPLPGVGLDDEADRGGSQVNAPTIDVNRTVEPDDWPGVALLVEEITADGRTVTIDLEISNQYDRTLKFLNRNPVLDDGHGNRFYYVDNATGDLAERQLELTPGDEASVRLSWRGRLDPNADTFSLTLNGLDRGGRPDLTTAPHIPIGDLPVPRPETSDE